jgi:hypothetical protein
MMMVKYYKMQTASIPSSGFMFRVKGVKAGIPTWFDQRHSFRDLREKGIVPDTQPDLLTPSNLLFPDI